MLSWQSVISGIFTAVHVDDTSYSTCNGAGCGDVRTQAGAPPSKIWSDSVSEKTYQIVSGVCLIAAILSAFLVDARGSWRWMAGCFGIAAGLTAISAYFYNL